MTSVDNMSSEFVRILNAWADATEETMEKAVTKTADETIAELRNAHPSGAEQYGSWDAYNNDWKKNTTKKRKGELNSTVYNKSHYQLTHLLEFGHAKVNGGRTRAFPHISIAEQHAETRLVENVEKGILAQ